MNIVEQQVKQIRALAELCLEKTPPEQHKMIIRYLSDYRRLLERALAREKEIRADTSMTQKERDKATKKNLERYDKLNIICDKLERINTSKQIPDAFDELRMLIARERETHESMKRSNLECRREGKEPLFTKSAIESSMKKIRYNERKLTAMGG